MESGNPDMDIVDLTWLFFKVFYISHIHCFRCAIYKFLILIFLRTAILSYVCNHKIILLASLLFQLPFASQHFSYRAPFSFYVSMICFPSFHATDAKWCVRYYAVETVLYILIEFWYDFDVFGYHKCKRVQHKFLRNTHALHSDRAEIVFMTCDSFTFARFFPIFSIFVVVDTLKRYIFGVLFAIVNIYVLQHISE